MSSADFIDIQITCVAQINKITLRCTKAGIITCRHPWQKCNHRKANPESVKCMMNRFIADVPKEIKRMKKLRVENMQKAFLTYLVFQREVKKRGLKTHAGLMRERNGIHKQTA